MKNWRWVLIVVVVAVACTVILRACGRHPGWDEQTQRQLQQLHRTNDSLATRLQTVQAALAARDSQIAELQASSRAHEESADALADSVVRLLRRARRVDTVWQAGVPIVTEHDDSVALATTCEQRYTLRTQESGQLRLSLADCRHENTLHHANEATLRSTLAVTAQQLHVTDSGLTWLRDNPPPCVQDLYVAHVACWKVEAGTGLLGLLVGLAH